MAYSLWLIPEEPDVRSLLQKTINNLANNYGGPTFEPHCTLLGGLNLTAKNVQQTCEFVAKQTKYFILETGIIDYSTTYYQCVFVRIKSSPELMNLYTSTKTRLGLMEAIVYMPHISLFYGDISYEKRHEIVRSFSFPAQKFMVKKIAIILSGADTTPHRWQRVAETVFSN